MERGNATPNAEVTRGTLAKMVREKLTVRGKPWTQQEMSVVAGYSVRTIYDLEHDRSVSPESLAAMVGALKQQIRTVYKHDRSTLDRLEKLCDQVANMGPPTVDIASGGGGTVADEAEDAKDAAPRKGIYRVEQLL